MAVTTEFKCNLSIHSVNIYIMMNKEEIRSEREILSRQTILTLTK